MVSLQALDSTEETNSHARSPTPGQTPTSSQSSKAISPFALLRMLRLEASPWTSVSGPACAASRSTASTGPWSARLEDGSGVGRRGDVQPPLYVVVSRRRSSRHSLLSQYHLSVRGQS